MTLPIERARSRKPITWLTLLGVLLLPAAVGGVLVTALQNPTERLDEMTAAIVNLDEAVTIDGQLTPLGRQLASGLVEGSDDLDSNLTWVISNEDDAADGLADGTYQAVITIPEDFSAAATSAGQAISAGGGEAADQAEQATIQVTTPPDGLVADDLITSQVASAASSTLGSMLSEATMSNVFLGFTTLGDQIGDAAEGADQLATGATDAATGAAAIPEGATQLATGATALGTGATDLATGLDTIAATTRQVADGATQLGNGLLGGATTLEQNGIVPDELYAGTSGVSQLTAGTAQGMAFLKTQLDALVAECEAAATAEFCAQLNGAATTAEGVSQTAQTSAGAAVGLATGVTTFDTQASATLATQFRDAGTAASSIAAGLNQLATDGIDASSEGATALASGATQLADGATQLSDGATELSTGLDSLASGTTELASGLHTASDSLPSFSDEESESLATVLADPVTSDASADTIFGPTAIPLLAAVVLWFGGLASFLVMRAFTANTLTSRRSSAALALRAFAPAAAIGAGQGLLVSLIVQFVASYDAATWWGFAGFAVLAGIVFAAVNQALVALFGGVGRWISALIGVLAVATGLISTVPDWLAGIGAALPTEPAFTGLIAADGSAAAALVVWGGLSLIATTLAVTFRRTTSTKAVLAAA